MIIKKLEIVAENLHKEPEMPSKSRIQQIALGLWSSHWDKENANLIKRKEEKQKGENIEKTQNKLERGKTLKKFVGAKEMESWNGNFLPSVSRTSSIFAGMGKNIDFVWPPIENVGMDDAKNMEHIGGSDFQMDEGNKMVDGNIRPKWDITSGIKTLRNKGFVQAEE